MVPARPRHSRACGNHVAFSLHRGAAARGGVGVCCRSFSWSKTLPCVAATCTQVRVRSQHSACAHLAGRDGAELSSGVGSSAPSESGTPVRRLLVDRRSGSDQRDSPRRTILGGVREDLRRRVDRRRGSERRSTLERRCGVARQTYAETPSEHLRNALQLLEQVTAVSELDEESRVDLGAALERVRRAVGMLERRMGG